ncbi:hypothetical protein K431DRAFT_284502 [Polychaeton citri CBS 116435]|uniref:Uncharacterized protein n=1 Tax=Polychaeton citri CBS 116435 TaxID=1314669 RepID=A0A9P4QBB0_9PEZI|nr:hypothetical protein K431DRAFT_284502 [Polychaeton citri CBS 116435]
MATVANTARLSARTIARHTSRSVSSRRAFQNSAQCSAASNFAMPALSPTMTEGNIAKWRIEEGQSYSAGDVLLEIETDKATMDVEAQEEGILFKIVKGNDSKGIQVGERIAVTAEEGDDLGSLELPADESPSKAADSGKEQSQPAKSEESAPAPKPSKPEPSAASSSSGPAAKARKQTYPLYPAVQHLLHENGLSKEDANNIPASGPAGRLLKGDVLAYLGKIQKDYPAQSSARLTKLGHLDLSNIQLAPPKEAPKKEAAKAELPTVPGLPKETKIALPISLSAVIATQKRVQDTLGVFLPLSTFIARASELANEDLPAGKRTPTQQDLFNAVLGLKSPPKISRGNYIPDVTGLATTSLVAPKQQKKSDIIDLLAPKAKKVAPSSVRPAAIGVVADGANIFSVTAKAGEEKRVAQYLERIKLVLEKDPGRLVV